MSEKENTIRAKVREAVESFAHKFEQRHIKEYDEDDGTIKMKIHNVFIAALREDIRYYTALVRSFDSSFGNMLENLATALADPSYIVSKKIKGYLYSDQTSSIAEILDKYERRTKEKPNYDSLRTPVGSKIETEKKCDYYLRDRETGEHCLIELKIGGDLDTKKARGEKEAILERYALLSNALLPDRPTIKIYFATAYNRFGVNESWDQERVKRFFPEEELLIGKKFWDFICKSPNGYDIVLDEYKKQASKIEKSLDNIKKKYLGGR